MVTYRQDDAPFEVEVMRNDELEVDISLDECLRNVLHANIGVCDHPRRLTLRFPVLEGCSDRRSLSGARRA